MVNCMVKSCKNRGKILGITYHQISRTYFKEWLNALNRKSDEKVSHRNVVCSQHFKTEDFKGGKHMFLKHGAVPSINLGEISSRETITHPDNSFPDSSAFQETPLSIIYTDSSVGHGSSSENTQPNKIISANDLMYEYCSQKDPLALGDDDIKKEPSLNELSDNEGNEDLQDEPFSIECSESEKFEDSTEIQKKIIKEFHDYSITPDRSGRLQIQRAVKSVKKKLKAAQQKHRRLERRIIRLKDMLEKLKRKSV